jgi:drug/metabolite transporter (DMT)-like permease
MREADGRAAAWRNPTYWVLFATVLWGLYWMPLVFLEGRGFAGVWPGLLLNLGALGISTAALLWRPPGWSSFLSRRTILGCGLCGVAVTLYASSILATEVARALLLFYLCPAWSTLIEMLFLGRRASGRRFLALASSALGLVALTGGELNLEEAGGLGDLMALISGFAWAVGTSLLFGSQRFEIRAGSFHAFLGACLTGFLLLPLLPSPLQAEALDWALGLGLGALYMLPVVAICLWGALRLPPGQLGFLLTGEIVSGLLSAALLLDQPFGWAEGLGALFICSAAASEAFAGKR